MDQGKRVHLGLELDLGKQAELGLDLLKELAGKKDGQRNPT